MRRLGPRHLFSRCAALALLLWPLAAAPLWACTSHSSVWDWDRCWLSLPRWLLFAAAAGGWWFLCFHRLFPLWLAPARNDAPLPIIAFRRCLALFWLLAWLTFIALFALLSDELSGGSARAWFARHWKWLLALVVALLGALVIWAPRRRARTTP